VKNGHSSRPSGRGLPRSSCSLDEGRAKEATGRGCWTKPVRQSSPIIAWGVEKAMAGNTTVAPRVRIERKNENYEELFILRPDAPEEEVDAYMSNSRR